MAATDKYTSERITWLHTWVPDKLFSFRLTRPQSYRFIPGQFARLGIKRPDPAAKDGSGYSIVWRAYSIVSASYDEYLEFYSIVVPKGEFTSQLADMREGDTVFVDKTSYGFLTTDRFENGRDLWMLSSGTGLAPFISILLELSTWETYERLILVHSVRETAELAYRELIESFKTHEYFGDFFKTEPQKLVYLPSVTRERPSGMLHSRITELLQNSALETAAGIPLDHDRSRIMICGNPDMVDDIRKTLSTRGYSVSRRGQPGNMAVENYW